MIHFERIHQGNAAAEAGHRVCPRPEEASTRRPLVAVKDVLWFLYLYPLRFLVSRLDAANLHRVGRLVEPLFQFVARGQRRVARERMVPALGARLDEAAIDAVSRRFIANSVVRALDDLHLARPEIAERLPGPEIRGLHRLDRAVQAGNGVVLITGHFYATRLIKRHLARMGYQIMSVRNRQPPDRWMGRLGARFLQPRYVEFLHQVIGDEVFLQDPDCSLKIFRRLRSGGLVNVHIDASKATGAVALPFLGQRREFATGLLEILRLSRCAVIPMLCLGNQLRASVEFGEPVVLEPAQGRQEFLTLNLERIVSVLEKQVLEHADEWEFWIRL